MPISSTTPINNYTGNSSTTVFPYNFYIPLEADLSVYFDGVIQASGFTVSGVGNSSGGNVTFSTAPTTGVTVRLERVTTRNRTTDYSEGGGLAADTLDADLDRVVAIVQEIDRATIQEDSDGKIDAVTRAIKNVVDPTDDQDVATKAYADINLTLTNADVVSTNADVVLTNADVISTGLDVISTNADVVLTNADVVSTNANVVLTNADVTYSEEWATKAEDSLISVAAGGDGTTDYSALHHAAKAAASAAPNEDIYTNIPSRNCLITADPLSQAGTSTAGVSSTIYTGNGTSQSITTGVDMSTGDLGGLVWCKSRSGVQDHALFDTVRGNTKDLTSSGTGVEITTSDSITSFDTGGFSLGANATGHATNQNTETYIAWNFQTNQKTTGTTNRGKAYTCHYNADMGFSIVGYEGDGADGHEIPHHLGVVPELIITKNRDTTNSTEVQSTLFNDDEYLTLSSTSPLASAASLRRVFSNTTISANTNGGQNGNTNNFISYIFTSKSGVCKVGKYIGTGAAGNYVSTEVDGGDAFKPSFVMVKNLTNAFSWLIEDGIRGDGSLSPDTSGVETSSDRLDFVDIGFVCNISSGLSNTLNDEYIFLAFAETSIDATKAIANYDKPTTADQLAIANPTTMTFANGFNATGQVDTQEQVLGGTLTFGAGKEDSKYYIYRDKDTAWGFSEVRPLTGLTRDDADKSGVVSPSDATLRTTAKHSDYESETGVVLASSELSASYAAYFALDKDSNDITANTQWLTNGVTTGTWQYKYNEARIPKSIRFRAGNTTTEFLKRFSIKGSQDGFNWTTLDSTYAAADYPNNGAGLWAGLIDLSAITTAYKYIQIDITANNGGAQVGFSEIELNTKIAADYYLEPEGKIYNDVGTRLDRVYVGECLTDASGNVTSFTNYSSGKKLINEIEVLGKATFHNEVLGRMFATAWVNFDGTQNPPLIRDSFNVKDVVDLGTGQYEVIFETPMDNDAYTGNVNTAGGNEIGHYASGSSTIRSAFIQIYGDVANALKDDDTVCVTIFGGKEIKGGNE